MLKTRMLFAKTLFLGLVALTFAACSGSVAPSVPQGPAAPAGEAPNRGTSVPGSAPSWGSESSASAPMMPYVPADPFEYKCEISVRAETYPNDPAAPRETWLSKSVVTIDNKKTSYSETDLNWGHFYRKSLQGEEIPPFATLTTPPPHKLDTFVMMTFTYPTEQVTPVGLTISMAIPNGATTSSRSNAGALSDKQLEASMRYSHEEKTPPVYTSITTDVSCEKTK
jgi:hypothetical protein